MTSLPKGAMPFKDLPVGPYLVLDRDDMSRWSELGRSAQDDHPTHWCMCERTHPLAQDKFIIDWLGLTNLNLGGGGGVTSWDADRWWCFPITSLRADQIFMHVATGVTRYKWHHLCDETVGIDTLC